MAQITVSYGVFNVVESREGKGVKVYTMQGMALWAFPNVEWWNMDGIITAMEGNKDVILQRKKEKNEYIKSRVG